MKTSILAAVALATFASLAPAQTMPNGGSLPSAQPILVFDAEGAWIYSLASKPSNVGDLVEAGCNVLERGGKTWAVVPAGVVDPNGPVYSTTWENQDGTTSTVLTPKLKGESKSNHAWRHGATVSALMKTGPGPVTAFSGAAAKFVGQAPQATEALTTSWQSLHSSGALLSHSVTTSPKPGETALEHVKRHNEAVQALMGVFKPAIPKTSWVRVHRAEAA